MTVYGIAITNTEGHIESFYIPGPEYPDEGAWDQDNTKTIVHVTTQFSDMSEFVRLKYYKEGTWKSRPEAPGHYYNWKDEAWVLDSAVLFKEIRDDRDIRLWKCDWTQASDSPLTDAKKTEWAEYRAALREVPQSNSGAKLLSEVVWPDMPS